MRLQAYKERILITPKELPQGIIVDTQLRYTEGEIYSVGEEVKTLQAGDKVRFSPFYDSIEVEGLKLVLIEPKDIIGIYKE